MHPRSNRGNTPPPRVEFQLSCRVVSSRRSLNEDGSARAKEDQRFKNG